MQSFGTKHSFCHKLLLQKEIRKKEILLKPLNMERHHHKFCVCLFCMLKCKVTTMVLALFAGRNCFYARCMTFFTSLCDVKTSLTYVTMLYVCMLSPHFVLLTSEHFYYMNERAESRLMNTDIGLLDKPDSHKLELNC